MNVNNPPPFIHPWHPGVNVPPHQLDCSEQNHIKALHKKQRYSFPHCFPALFSFHLFLLPGITFLISCLLLANWILWLPMLLPVLLLNMWCCLTSPTPVSNLRLRKRLKNPYHLQNTKSNPSLNILHHLIIACLATPFKNSWAKAGWISIVLIITTLIATSGLQRSRF